MPKTHPFDQTMNELFTKLENGLKQRQEADIQITTNTAAIRALANTCEDEEVKGEYILRLDEISGKQGFVDAIRRAMLKGVAMTPMEIRSLIVLLKLMDLSGYSNAMASIHTTLRRMKEKGQVEEVRNTKGEKAFRLLPGSPGVSLPNQTDIADQKLSAQDRFQIAHTIRKIKRGE